MAGSFLFYPGSLEIPSERQRGRAHFYTWSAAMYRALCEATALTPECQGRLRRSVPYKGLRPLRRFAAIPHLCGKLNIFPYDRFTFAGKMVFFIF